MSLVDEMIPQTVGPAVYVRPVLPSDYGFIASLDTSLDDALNWRHGGVLPPPQSYLTSLWSGVLEQVLIVRRLDDVPVGFATAYNFSRKNSTVWVSVASVREARGNGLALAGMALLISRLFSEWPIRKVFAESLEFNYSTFAGASRAGVVEVVGELTNDYVLQGRMWSRIYLSIDRESWLAGAGRFLRARQQQFPSSRWPGKAVGVGGDDSEGHE